MRSSITASHARQTRHITNIAVCAVPKIFGEQTYGSNKNQSLINYTQSRGAARKGIRIQRSRENRLKAAKRRLLEAQFPKKKKIFETENKIDKFLVKLFNERTLDEKLPEAPIDDVYFYREFKKPRIPFEECIEFYKQLVHEDVLNQKNSLIQATFDLYCKMKVKKKKYIETIETTVCFPHTFKYQMKSRSIIAMCKDEEQQVAARKAGASLVGGLDIGILLKTKQLTQRDFDYIVCHTDLLLDFSSIKGMKGSPFFPTKQRGNFGNDMPGLVSYFLNGIDYSLKKNPNDQTHGLITCYFGNLGMTNKQLKENFQTLTDSILRFEPSTLESGYEFIQRVMISIPSNDQLLIIDHRPFLQEEESDESIEGTPAKDVSNAS